MEEKSLEKVSADAFLQSERLNQMMKVAQQFHKAGCFGGDVKNAEQAFVKIQAGIEMGMPPMEAMNSLYIVNGKITIWGSAMTKKIREAGWSLGFEDEVDQAGNPVACTVTIKKGDEDYSEKSTKQQLVALKSRAFQFAPKEKLRWHAIAQLIKFQVPEVLGGVVMYMKEELEDLPRERVDVAVVDDTEIPQADDVVAELKDCDMEKFKEIEEKLPKIINHYTEEDKKKLSQAFKKRRDELIEKVASETPVVMMTEDDHGVIVDGKKVSTKNKKPDIDIEDEGAVDAELEKVSKQAGKDRERGELPNPKK